MSSPTTTTTPPYPPHSNPSWQLLAPQRARITLAPLPPPLSPTAVLIRISHIGVCGSDVHFYTHGGIAHKTVQALGPIVMGHEASGTVAGVGAAVRNVRVGDRVAIEPGVHCRRCARCRGGEYNLCPGMRFAACPGEGGREGCLSRFWVGEADLLWVLPEDVGLDEAVLVEPLAVGVHANRMVGVKPAESVVVLGAGTVGVLSAALAGKVYGAGMVVVCDVSEEKVRFAREFLGEQGEVVGFVVDVKDTPEENARKIIEMARLVDEDGVRGADCVIEASGAESSVNTAVHVLRLGGQMVQTGLGKPSISFPIAEFSEKEIHMHGAFRYSEGDFKMAMYALRTGLVRVKSLISNVFAFEDAPKAWEATRDGKGIKNLIKVEGI